MATSRALRVPVSTRRQKLGPPRTSPSDTIVPMLLWDVIRNRRVHTAYWWFLALYVASAAVVELAWDRAWWHATAKAIMGVG